MARRRDIDQLQNEIQELFADLWQVPRFSGLRAGFRPQIDCYRTSDPAELVVLVELPGVDPASIELVVAEGTLQVGGERTRPRCAGQVYQQMELDYGPFRRQISLGDDVDVTRARATYDQGILKVVAPIAPRQRPTARVSIVVTRE
jgi:HSP20 family protein